MIRCFTILTSLLLLMLLTVQSSVIRGAEEEAMSALVRQLGHPKFSKRVAAEQQILETGIYSLSEVTAGTASNDPEIRQRSQRLLARLQKIAFNEQRHLIEENPWLFNENVAPAWEFYHSIMGDSAESRKLYVQMIEQEADLMMMAGQNAEAFADEFDRHCLDLKAMQDRRSSARIPPVKVATLLFLGVHPDNDPSPQAINALNSLVNHSSFSQVLKSQQMKQPLQPLLTHWIEHAPHITPQSRLLMASTFESPAGLTAAREIVANRHATGTYTPSILQGAIATIALWGGDEGIEELEKLLEDQTAIQTVSHRSTSTATRHQEVQIADLALLGLVQMTGQNPRDYGFSGIRLDGHLGSFNISATFSSQKSREDAMNNWKTWRAKNLRPKLTPIYDATEGTLL